ncbi:hypothetical protein EVAR_63254_1 [Eumeta japonica]|uniref:Uncharacterized protein n=1 Tax=Eumeta variegata TaxID=151549 RepID=A0A4C1ZYF0_EUMVA|nr:hypothetical protein EVAR_63254_1 [Eumeta japonica]
MHQHTRSIRPSHEQGEQRAKRTCRWSRAALSRAAVDSRGAACVSRFLYWVPVSLLFQTVCPATCWPSSNRGLDHKDQRPSIVGVPCNVPDLMQLRVL